ncbi:hypothetical protein PR003_g12973 [Phytophthora rubi]|uniref:WRKY19-like zinc finger domain-containing protein n=1 Tax=Phytophthora rubi TaxID=129364 RepID=A0A6A4F7R8_9STRA|nr:hypothetical protein PR003_g12973 [Phytophthora rubi]
MMMMHGSAPLYSRPAAPEGETISISIGLGNDRSSSIVLPRGHDLVKHLERLIPAASSPQPPLQPLLYAKTQESAAARFDAVRALSSLPYQQSPTQAPISSMSQYIHANSRYETSAAVPAPRSPLYHSDSSSNGGVRVYHHTPEYLEHAGESRATSTRRRRGANGASSGKRCQVVGCDKISVSRGLCRGHGGGRRCQHVGCTKGAQSRSDFCWAHGGGQRCEVKGCMRSRKSKRFCVAHLNWENTAPVSSSPVYETLPRQMELPMPIVPKTVSSVGSLSPTALNGSPRLPSLLQALRNTQQSSMTVQS